MSTHHTPDLAQRTAKLERYLLLSSLLPFWFAVELLMILAGTGNLLFRGLGNTQGLAMLLIGGCMAIAHFSGSGMSGPFSMRRHLRHTSVCAT